MLRKARRPVKVETSSVRLQEPLLDDTRSPEQKADGSHSRNRDVRFPGERRAWFLYRSCELTWYFCRWLLDAVPAGAFRRLVAPIISAVILFAVPKRRIVRVLDTAFGQSYADGTKKGLARGVQQHFAANVLDSLLHIGHPDRLRANLSVDGLEHLDTALAQGKGVIALGFHMGNFLLVGAALTLEGYPIHSLFRFFDDPRLMALVHRDSHCFFSSLIPSMPRREAVKNILERLKANETVLILADNLKRGEIETTLFDQHVRSARGPISLAIRSSAAVLPVYLIRDYSGGLKLVIEPELEVIRTGNLSSDIAANTDRVIRHLENLIRKYPDQWHWLTVRMKNTQKSG